METPEEPCFGNASGNKRRERVLFWLGSILLITSVPAFAEPSPTLILHHGKIVTVDAEFSIAEAIAVAEDRILAVGSNDTILALKRPETKVIDLEGKMLLPGLMDSHVHPSAAMTEFDHEIPVMETIADVLAFVSSRARASQPGDLITVRQVFITRLAERRYPTRAELDGAAPANPVIFSTGPDSMLNSLAMKLAGIDREFIVPEGQPGKVETDPSTGEPTGLLRGLGVNVKASQSVKTPAPEDIYRRTAELFHDYNSVGLTTVCDRDSNEDAVALYQKMREQGDLTVRMRVSMGIPPLGLWPITEKAIDKIIQHPLRKPDPLLQIIGTKCYLDGGMLTGSAFMIDPWGVSKIYGITDPTYRGEQKIPTDRLRQLVVKVVKSGLQFTAHSVGDAAVQTLVDVYEDVNREFPIRDSRSSITHCNFMTPGSIEKAARLGITIDMQPIWLHLDGATLMQQFGNERLSRFQPLRSLFDNHITVGGGSDHMQKIGSFRSVNAYNPWLGIQTAITRMARNLDAPLHPENVITRAEAIRLYTLNNARLLFLESETGSLEKGKLADMILLDRDVLSCPADQIRDTRVLTTWLAGRTLGSPVSK